MPNLLMTTLAGALDSSNTTINVTSATGIFPPNLGFPQKIMVFNPSSPRGEEMTVVSVNGTAINVSRLGKFKQAFVNGATVLIAPQTDPQLGPAFQAFDPTGGSFKPQLSSSYQPWVSMDSGLQFIFSTVENVWVAGWGNTQYPAGVTAAVASAAGLITPSGPLFHVTGTAAITGFTLPVGWIGGGSFTIIPDAIFTWTAANNIAVAGTAVVGKPITFTQDFATGKFYPSSVA